MRCISHLRNRECIFIKVIEWSDLKFFHLATQHLHEIGWGMPEGNSPHPVGSHGCHIFLINVCKPNIVCRFLDARHCARTLE